jgi:CheY-like chemotaxis protein/two-component sensor histidine kinase
MTQPQLPQPSDGHERCEGPRHDAGEAPAAWEFLTGQFLATLSHELRNPLAPILNSVQWLQLRESGDAAQKRAVAIIERQVRQLTHALDDLSDVARLLTGRIQLTRVRVLASDIVGRVVAATSSLLEARHHELTVSLPSEPLWLEVDAARIEQVLRNLVTNAAVHTRDGGRIWITVEQADGQAVLCARDEGPGIAAEVLPHIFELFAQKHAAAETCRHRLGLGLTWAKRLVELHGGTICVLSANDQGSQFTVRLPLGTPAAATPAPSPVPCEVPAAAPLDPARLRVLVVDDHVPAADILELLVRELGHQVRTAHTGVAALGAALDFRPQVALLDIELPDLSGYELAKRLRQESVLAGIVLVAMTGYGDESDRRQSQEAGFDHHLLKPADFDNVRRILTDALQKAI